MRALLLYSSTVSSISIFLFLQHCHLVQNYLGISCNGLDSKYICGMGDVFVIIYGDIILSWVRFPVKTFPYLFWPLDSSAAFVITIMTTSTSIVVATATTSSSVATTTNMERHASDSNFTPFYTFCIKLCCIYIIYLEKLKWFFPSFMQFKHTSILNKEVYVLFWVYLSRRTCDL